MARISNLDDRARQQATRDAAAKSMPATGGGSPVLSWFLQRRLKTKMLLTVVTMFGAYAATAPVLTLVGLRDARLVVAKCDDERWSIQEQAACKLAQEQAEEKQRKRDTEELHENIAQARAKREALDAELKRQREAARVRKKEDERIAWIKDEPTRKARELERLHARAKEEGRRLREMLAKRLVDEKSAYLNAASDLLRGYERANPQLLSTVSEESVLAAQLRTVRSMLAESAIALIEKSFGRVSANTIEHAIGDLAWEQHFGKPEQLEAFAASPRLPLYPAPPRLNAPAKYGSIDGKPVTASDLAEMHKLDAKRDLRAAIIGLYLDCEEHFRDRYLIYMVGVFDLYLGRLTEPAASKPQDVIYPLFLLSPEATPAERLEGALIILAEGKITSAARRGLLEAPQGLLGERCPPGREKFFLLGSSQLATIRDKDAPLSLAADSRPSPAEISKALAQIHQECRPWNRSFLASYARNLVALKLAPHVRLRPPAPSDAGWLQRLRGANRPLLYAALQELVEVRVVSPEIRAELPRAAERLFHDFCPAIPNASELDDYRALVDEKLAAREVWLTKDRERKVRATAAKEK